MLEVLFLLIHGIENELIHFLGLDLLRLHGFLDRSSHLENLWCKIRFDYIKALQKVSHSKCINPAAHQTKILKIYLSAFEGTEPTMPKPTIFAFVVMCPAYS